MSPRVTPRVPTDDGGKVAGGQGTSLHLGRLVEATQTQKPPRLGLRSPGNIGAGMSGSAVTPLLSPPSFPSRSVSGVHQNDQPRRGARHQEADVRGREGRLRGHRSVTGTGQQPPRLPLPSRRSSASPHGPAPVGPAGHGVGAFIGAVPVPLYQAGAQLPAGTCPMGDPSPPRPRSVLQCAA